MKSMKSALSLVLKRRAQPNSCTSSGDQGAEAAQRMEMPEENDSRCSALASESRSSHGPRKIRGGGLAGRTFGRGLCIASEEASTSSMKAPGHGEARDELEA